MFILFETTTINGMNIKNRFVRSATYEAMADLDGKATDQLLECMAQLAQGGPGACYHRARPCGKGRAGRSQADGHLFTKEALHCAMEKKEQEKGADHVSK